MKYNFTLRGNILSWPRQWWHTTSQQLYFLFIFIFLASKPEVKHLIVPRYIAGRWDQKCRHKARRGRGGKRENFNETYKSGTKSVAFSGQIQQQPEQNRINKKRVQRSKQGKLEAWKHIETNRQTDKRQMERKHCLYSSRSNWEMGRRWN